MLSWPLLIVGAIAFVASANGADELAKVARRLGKNQSTCAMAAMISIRA